MLRFRREGKREKDSEAACNQRAVRNSRTGGSKDTNYEEITADRV